MLKGTINFFTEGLFYGEEIIKPIIYEMIEKPIPLLIKAVKTQSFYKFNLNRIINYELCIWSVSNRLVVLA